MSIAVFCLFLVLRKIHTKQSPNATKLFDVFFWNIRDPEDSREYQKSHEEVTRYLGAANGWPCQDTLWALVAPLRVILMLKLFIYLETPES